MQDKSMDSDRPCSPSDLNDQYKHFGEKFRNASPISPAVISRLKM